METMSRLWVLSAAVMAGGRAEGLGGAQAMWEGWSEGV